MNVTQIKNNKQNFGMNLKIGSSLVGKPMSKTVIEQLSELQQKAKSVYPYNEDVYLYNGIHPFLPKDTFELLLPGQPINPEKSIGKTMPHIAATLSPSRFTQNGLLTKPFSMKKAVAALEKLSKKYREQDAELEKLKQDNLYMSLISK